MIEELILSKRLRDKIYKENYEFNDYELYKIVYHSVNSVEERIKWSLYFSKNSEDKEVKGISTTLYDHLNKNYSLFKALNSNEFYNLIIKYKNKEVLNIISYDLVDYHFWVNIKFPSFFKDCDLVVLNGDENDLSIDNLGVVRHDTDYYYKDEFFDSIAYVIRLNNSFVIENKLEEKYEDGIFRGLEYHTHIPFILLKFVDPNRLDKYEKDRYNYLTTFIKKCL